MNRSNAASMGETGTGVAVGSGAVVGVAVGSGAVVGVAVGSGADVAVAVGAGTSVGAAVAVGAVVDVGAAGAVVGVSAGSGTVAAVAVGAGTPVAVAGGGCVGSAASSWQAARVRANADIIATNVVSLRRITLRPPTSEISSHRKRAQPRVAGICPQLFLNSQQTVVLAHPLAAGRRARLDLARARGNGKVGDGGVLRLP